MALKHQLCLVCPLVLALVAGCEREPESTQEAEAPQVEDLAPVTQVDPELEAATHTAWSQGEALLQDAIASADRLHSALDTFLQDPQNAALEETRKRWHEAHQSWHQLDPLLAMAKGNPGLFSRLARLEFRVDAPLLHPGYLDSVTHYPYSGIVNDISLDIQADALREQHGLTDESDVSLGFHALEFLLWGEEGERSAEAFQRQNQTTAEQQEAGLTVADLPQNRRRDLTLLISQLILDDLTKLDDLWSREGSWLHSNYHKLHPASRVQLLKNASEHYLGAALPEAVTSHLSDETAHNRFAGRSQALMVSGLQGLNQILTAGEPPLRDWLGDAEATQNWLSELQETTQLLEAQLNEENAEQVREQLQALSDFVATDALP